jgi:signal transduction histidine kinase
LLLVSTVAFAWAAYVGVRHVLLTAAEERLASASVALDVSFGQSMARLKGQLEEAAAEPTVGRYLESGRDTAGARRVLAELWVGDPVHRHRVELRRPDGSMALDTSVGDAPALSLWATGMLAKHASDSVRIGPLRTAGGGMYLEAIAPVWAAGSARSDSRRLLGYMTEVRGITAQNMQSVRDLIGSRATMLVGSPPSGMWTDFEHEVSAPPVDAGPRFRPRLVTNPDGTLGIGVAAPVPGAPWTMWVEQPASAALAPTRILLQQFAGFAAAIILIGAALAWLLSRRITDPIASLTASADEVAAATPVPPARGEGNEIVRLAEAFHRMARRVRHSLDTAENARSQAEGLAGQLQERTVKLEQQTAEAQALAQELELQFEEAQALSEELEQSNDQMQLSVTEAESARASAEAANRAKLDFLASMSHELRTPLNAIAGYVELLDLGVAGPIGEEQRRYLARIQRAQGLLLTRINDMLNFAKIDSGTMSYHFTTVQVDDVLAGMESLIQPALTQRDLSYEYVPPRSPLSIRVDREKLEQVLLNLLSNAAKFTPSGGRITLSCEQRNGSVGIMVTDTGIGIPTEKLTLVFEPFVQLDTSLTHRRDGTGLGLAIARDLARGMGGELTAASTVGVGSTFTLTLPLVAANAPADVMDLDADGPKAVPTSRRL